MKLTNLVEEKKEKRTGTYSAVTFTSDTDARIRRFVKKNEIPNGLTTEYHSTVIYSRKEVPELKALGKFKKKWIGKPTGLKVFETHDGPEALVLIYDCKEQKERHEHIMDTTDATYDYPNYDMHVTLSYDIGDADKKELLKLPIEQIGDIIIDNEYVEPFEVDWTP